MRMPDEVEMSKGRLKVFSHDDLIPRILDRKEWYFTFSNSFHHKESTNYFLQLIVSREQKKYIILLLTAKFK